MKITLEFDGTEEQEEVRTALDGWKWKLVVWDLDQELRSKSKYASDKDDPNVIEAYYKLREELRDILNSYNLNLEQMKPGRKKGSKNSVKNASKIIKNYKEKLKENKNY